MKIASMLLALLGCVATALGAEVSFTTKPTAVKDGERVKISFAVSAATDVEVAVLDKDGKDDLGEAAGGGPFKVKVALGLKPTFNQTIGDNPAFMDCVRALAVGPNG